jgi:uncharacterized protein GlcG (DUF336 family)
MSGSVIRSQNHVTYETAADLVQSGLEEARRQGLIVTVVITDSVSQMVAMARMDGASSRTITSALGE